MGIKSCKVFYKVYSQVLLIRIFYFLIPNLSWSSQRIIKCIFHLVQLSAKLNFFFFFDTAIRFWLDRLIASWNIYFFLIPNFSFFLFLFATNYKMIFFFLFNYHKIATCSVEKEKKMFCHSIFQVWLLDRLIASWKWCTSWPRTSRITGCWEFFRVLLQFLISCVRWRAEERGSSLCKR